MNILCVDDERLALEALGDAAAEELPEATIISVRSCSEALVYAEKTAIDVAFLDIEMREMNGLQLAKRLKELNRATNIVFVTGYEDYALEAFGVNASSYVIKPVTPKAIRSAMDNLRCPVASNTSPALRVQCFGNFEVFYNGEPLKFKYQKTKELFAYLIDRKGTICPNGELMGILWDDDAGDKKRSYLSNLSLDLTSTLASLGCGNIVMKRRGALYVVPEKLNCDYYDWNKGMLYAINAYCGEYMSQFSWAEMTLGALERKNR